MPCRDQAAQPGRELQAAQQAAAEGWEELRRSLPTQSRLGRGVHRPLLGGTEEENTVPPARAATLPPVSQGTPDTDTE